MRESPLDKVRNHPGTMASRLGPIEDGRRGIHNEIEEKGLQWVPLSYSPDIPRKGALLPINANGSLLSLE